MQNPSFSRLIFFGVLTLTVLSLIVQVITITCYTGKIDNIKDFMDTYSTTWKMGFGAIIGLLGGRAIADTGEKENTQKPRKNRTPGKMEIKKVP